MQARLKHRVLARRLNESRLSQNHWAMRLGISRGHFSELLRGKHPFPSARTRQKLLQGLGMRFEDLFEAEEGRSSARRNAGTTALLDWKTRRLRLRLERLTPPRRPQSALGSQGDTLMQSLFHDLRYAMRAFSQRPAVTVAAVLTLALGLGANTAIFSLANALLIQPLPYGQSERLVRLFGTSSQRESSRANLNPLDLIDFRQQAESFEGIAYATRDSVTLTGAGQPLRLRLGLVSPDYFKLLGIEPTLGRGFLPHEEAPGKDLVAVISYGLWQDRFGGDPDVIGGRLTVDGQPLEVIGVAPPFFRDPFLSWAEPSQAWSPYALDLERTGRGGHFMKAVGRLKAGRSLEQADAQLQTVQRLIQQEHPAKKGRGVRVEPLHEALTGQARPAVMLLLGAVGFVLLVGCANIANLQLARSLQRRREMAIRTALGAARRRLMRQVLVESLLLSLAGGAAGALFAVAGVGALATTLPEQIPRLVDLAVDRTVLLFAFVISAATGIAVGWIPALQASLPDLQRSLHDGGYGATAGRMRQRLRGALVVAEVALSLMLLVGAGLLMRSFWNLLQVDPGFQPDRLLTLRLSLPQSLYPQRSQVIQFFEQLLQDVQSLPGVESAGATNRLPLTGNYSCDGFSLQDRPDPPPEERGCVEERVVLGEFLQAMGMRLAQGRGFEASHDEKGAGVVLINQSMAEQFWPGENPLGQKFKWGRRDSEEPWRAVVGVVEDVKHFGLEGEVRPEVYMPHAHKPYRSLSLTIRTQGEPEGVLPSVRARIAQMDPNLPLFDVHPMDEILFETLAARRMLLLLIGLFAGIALLMALIGVYGVLALGVSQRIPEIGVRMALGAHRQDVLRLVLRQGLSMALLGAALGLAGAAALSRLLSGLLFGVSPLDLPTFAATALLLLLAALFASYLPARRATRVNPLDALRAG